MENLNTNQPELEESENDDEILYQYAEERLEWINLDERKRWLRTATLVTSAGVLVALISIFAASRSLHQSLRSSTLTVARSLPLPRLPRLSVTCPWPRSCAMPCSITPS